MSFFGQVIRNAIAIECSNVAKNALILYRAGGWHFDTHIDSQEMLSKSLSYGTSLFAGVVRDPTATVFYYTVEENRDTYAVVVPFNKYQDSPFLFSSTPALVQLLSMGEFFHARSKVLKRENECYVSGIWGMHKRSVRSWTWTTLKWERTLDELVALLNDYHKNSFLLTPSHNPRPLFRNLQPINQQSKQHVMINNLCLSMITVISFIFLVSLLYQKKIST